MTTCSVHRGRYERLWRLPTVATIGPTTIVTVVAAGISGLVGPPWMPVLVLVAGVAVSTAYLRRHRARVALEAKLVRALRQSGSGCPGDAEVPGLRAPVRAEAMPDGVVRIEADSWLDAVHALGYVMARDRAFHLDLLRRTATGHLAEVWGRTALPIDQRYRPLGLASLARTAAAGLETPERDLLTAFAAGVNASAAHHGPPFEARFLSYRPKPWTVEDSLVIALYLFHALSWNEPSKRAEAVIRHALPEPIAAFFLPGFAANDPLDGPLGDPRLPAGLSDFRASATGETGDIIAVDRAIAGSNCWIRGGADGARPLLACDLHLPLTMPNLLYEVDLRWGDQRVQGLAAPGLPVVLTGGNGHIVWGMTNLSADVLDLVPIDPDESARLTTDTERISVRGRPDTLLVVNRDATMPVFPGPLPNQRVAIRWTGQDPRSCDLKFQRLAQASSVEESIKVLGEAQGIALNVLVADEDGHLAHLATGLLPRRPVDAPGVVAGYLDGTQRPRLVDPPSGILVSANDAALSEHPFQIGYDLDPGYRARRVRDVLARTRDADPAAMRALQHDTAAELYLPYRDLAVSALARRADVTADLLATWTGEANVDSRAFAILVRLREILAARVLSPYLVVCRQYDPSFQYPFRSIDRPLLAILRSADPSLLPAGERPAGEGSWSEFVAGCVDQAMTDLKKSAKSRNWTASRNWTTLGNWTTARKSTALAGLPSWGQLNSVGLNHPLEGLAPWAGALLGIKAKPQSGALHSVRTCVPGFAAVGRAVLAPGADSYAAFELPGGQSGHPLSAHYDDRHGAWSSPVPRANRPQRAGCAFVLRPTRSDGDQSGGDQ